MFESSKNWRLAKAKLSYKGDFLNPTACGDDVNMFARPELSGSEHGSDKHMLLARVRTRSCQDALVRSSKREAQLIQISQVQGIRCAADAGLVSCFRGRTTACNPPRPCGRQVQLQRHCEACQVRVVRSFASFSLFCRQFITHDVIEHDYPHFLLSGPFLPGCSAKLPPALRSALCECGLANPDLLQAYPRSTPMSWD